MRKLNTQTITMTSVVSDPKCLFCTTLYHFYVQIENMHLKAWALFIFWKHECLYKVSFTSIHPTVYIFQSGPKWLTYIGWLCPCNIVGISFLSLYTGLYSPISLFTGHMLYTAVTKTDQSTCGFWLGKNFTLTDRTFSATSTISLMSSELDWNMRKMAIWSMYITFTAALRCHVGRIRPCPHPLLWECAQL